MSRVKRIALFSAAGLVTGTVVLLIHFIGLFDPLEKKVSSIQSLDMPAIGEIPVCVVEISDLGNNPWPWPRLDYALMLRAVGAFAPRLVAIESPLVGSDTFFANYDRLLADAVKRVPRVIYPAAALSVGNSSILPGYVKSIPFAGNIHGMPEYKSAFLPYELFAKTGEIGFSNLGYDSDGVVRKIPMVYRFGTSLSPSWTLVLYGTAKDVDWLKSRVILGKEIILKNAKDAEVLRIPIDENGQTPIRFRSKRKIPRWDFGTVLLASEQTFNKEKTVIDLNVLRGKCVVIGRAMKEIVEPVQTPIGEMYPLDVHLQMLANLFQNDFRKNLSEPLVCGLILFLAIFSSVVMTISHGTIRFAAAVMLIMGAVLYKLGFSVFSITAPSVAFACAILGGILTGAIMRIAARL